MSPVNVYRDGKVYVRDVECSQCLLGADRLVSGARAREYVATTRATPGSSFVCHRSAVSDEPESICAGWWARFHGEDAAMMLADALGVVERVETESGDRA